MTLPKSASLYLNNFARPAADRLDTAIHHSFQEIVASNRTLPSASIPPLWFLNFSDTENSLATDRAFHLEISNGEGWDTFFILILSGNWWVLKSKNKNSLLQRINHAKKENVICTYRILIYSWDNFRDKCNLSFLIIDVEFAIFSYKNK